MRAKNLERKWVSKENNESKTAVTGQSQFLFFRPQHIIIHKAIMRQMLPFLFDFRKWNFLKRVAHILKVCCIYSLLSTLENYWHPEVSKST